VDEVTIARAVHVVAVVHWMGGVAFVTTVILPAISVITEPSRRLELFEVIEHRFSAQVKVSVPVAGLSGAYMAERLDVWGRFVTPDGWWLAAMAIIWLAFMAILFVVEPFALRRWFHLRAMADPAATFRLVQRAHWTLLAAGTVVAACGVLGAHGFLG
jgi:uncharacterized membrane protein